MTPAPKDDDMPKSSHRVITEVLPVIEKIERLEGVIAPKQAVPGGQSTTQETLEVKLPSAYGTGLHIDAATDRLDAIYQGNDLVAPDSPSQGKGHSDAP